MFQFECFQRLLCNGAKTVDFDQCMYGGPKRKPTTVLYGSVDFTSLKALCNHTRVEQSNETKGTKYWLAHPTYVGKKDSKGAYLTGSLAAYPTKLNCRLATLINQSLTNDRPTS